MKEVYSHLDHLRNTHIVKAVQLKAFKLTITSIRRLFVFRSIFGKGISVRVFLPHHSCDGIFSSHFIYFMIFYSSYFISFHAYFSLISYLYSSLLFYFMSLSTVKLHVIVLSMSSMRCQPAIDLWARSTLAVVAHLQRDSSAVRPTTPLTWLESKVRIYTTYLQQSSSISWLFSFGLLRANVCINPWMLLKCFQTFFQRLKILAFAVKFGRCLFVSFRFCRFTFFSLISFPKGQSENMHWSLPKEKMLCLNGNSDVRKRAWFFHHTTSWLWWC